MQLDRIEWLHSKSVQIHCSINNLSLHFIRLEISSNYKNTQDSLNQNQRQLLCFLHAMRKCKSSATIMYTQPIWDWIRSFMTVVIYFGKSSCSILFGFQGCILPGIALVGRRFLAEGKKHQKVGLYWCQSLAENQPQPTLVFLFTKLKACEGKLAKRKHIFLNGQKWWYQQPVPKTA